METELLKSLIIGQLQTGILKSILKIIMMHLMKELLFIIETIQMQINLVAM